MSKDKIEKNYVSPTDRFLNQFDETHSTLSVSQQKEIAKYQRITRLRDTVTTTNSTNQLPEDF